MLLSVYYLNKPDHSAYLVVVVVVVMTSPSGSAYMGGTDVLKR